MPPRSVGEQLIHDFLLEVKAGLLDTSEGLGEINKAALRAIDHQDQVRTEFDSESDSLFLACIQGFKGSIPGNIGDRNGILPMMVDRQSSIAPQAAPSGVSIRPGR